MPEGSQSTKYRKDMVKSPSSIRDTIKYKSTVNSTIKSGGGVSISQE
jgi:hypothetical protein